MIAHRSMTNDFTYKSYQNRLDRLETFIVPIRANHGEERKTDLFAKQLQGNFTTFSFISTLCLIPIRNCIDN